MIHVIELDSEEMSIPHDGFLIYMKDGYNIGDKILYVDKCDDSNYLNYEVIDVLEIKYEQRLYQLKEM